MKQAIRNVVATGAIAGAILAGSAATAAADPPYCTAADLAGIMSGVTAATSAYLFTHPDVNDFFTSLKGKPKDEIRTEALAFMDSHPDAKADLQGIRQPSVDFRERCGADAPVQPE